MLITVPIKHLAVVASDKFLGELLPTTVQGLSFSTYTLSETADKFIITLARIEVPKHIEPGSLAIYIDAHGDDQGIDFNDHTALEWRDFAAAIYSVARRVRRPIFLFMASCEGLNIAKLAASDSPCPFSAVGGSLKRQPDGVFFNWFVEFVHNYNKSLDFKLSVQEMNATHPDWQVYAITRERLVRLTTQYVKSIYEETDYLLNSKADAIEQLQDELNRDPSFMKVIDWIYSPEQMTRRLIEAERIRLSDPF